MQPTTLFAQASQPQNYHFFNKNNTIAVIFINNNIFLKNIHCKTFKEMFLIYTEMRPSHKGQPQLDISYTSHY